MLGGMIGCEAGATALAAELEQGLERYGQPPRRFRAGRGYISRSGTSRRSRGIRWVSELVAIAGGEDVFPELAQCSLGKDRIIADPLEVVRRAPDVIFGSWCGKKFRPRATSPRARAGQDVPAVRDGELHEVKSSIILQPGPAALTDGVRELHRVIAAWVAEKGSVPALCGQAAQGFAGTSRGLLSITSAGSRGPGALLFQSSVSR